MQLARRGCSYAAEPEEGFLLSYLFQGLRSGQLFEVVDFHHQIQFSLGNWSLIWRVHAVPKILTEESPSILNTIHPLVKI